MSHDVRAISELEDAKQALSSGWPADDEADEPPPIPPTPPVDGPWGVPPHLALAPALRDAALRAVDSGRTAAARPADYDAVLQHGLNLQELAAQLGADADADAAALLHRAADAYRRANDLRGGRAAVVLFNWAVALSDISRLAARADPGEAAEMLAAAAVKYAAALSVDPGNAQALNNWGLVLQDLAAMAPPAQRRALVHAAVARFRAAIRLQPDGKLTARFAYNLGTVLYSSACALQDALLGASPGSAAAGGGGSSGGGGGQPERAAEERAVRCAFADAAQYILLAAALQPAVEVFEQSLTAVQRLLPLPYLRAGALLVAAPPPAAGTAAAAAAAAAAALQEDWVRAWFVLDGQVLQSVRPPAAEAARLAGPVPSVAIDVEDIVDAQTCLDPSLPPGVAIWVGLKSRPRGVFLVADDREGAEAWTDALRLLALLHKTDARAEGLQAALTARRRR